MKIGFCYDQPEGNRDSGEAEDLGAEYETERTLDAMRESLSEMGTVVDLPWSRELFSDLKSEEPDVVFNICESGGSRNRESYVPNFCEVLGIPHTGADGLALGLSLDKGLTKHLARSTGINTSPFAVVEGVEEVEEKCGDLRFPLFVKPNNEGSSMGIRQDSKVGDLGSLKGKVSDLLCKYREPVLVEEFLPGREFAVGLLEREGGMETLPVAEVLVQGEDTSFYSYEFKSDHASSHRCPASLDSHLEGEMIHSALRIFRAIGARDLARVDFRLDREGKASLVEINPLPGLSPFGSTYPVQAKEAGIEYQELIEELVGSAAERGGLFDRG